MMTRGNYLCRGAHIYTQHHVGTGNCFSHSNLDTSDTVESVSVKFVTESRQVKDLCTLQQFLSNTHL